MLTTRAWVSRNRCRATAEPMKPAPPVTKMVEPLNRVTSAPRERLLAFERPRDRHQIFAVAALGAALRRLFEFFQRNVALAQRDLLGAGDAQALSLLEDLHEM